MNPTSVMVIFGAPNYDHDTCGIHVNPLEPYRPAPLYCMDIGTSPTLFLHMAPFAATFLYVRILIFKFIGAWSS